MGFAANQAGCRTVVGERAEQLDGGCARVDHQRGPVLQVRAARACREADVGQGGLGVHAQPVAVPVGELCQCGRCLGRQRKDAEPAVAGLFDRSRCRLDDRRLFEDDVCVGAGEPERADPGDPGAVSALPRDGLLHDLHGKPVPRNVRRRVLEVEVFGQRLVLQCQHDLDDACDPRCGLEVADVGLGRADQQRVVRRAPGAVHGTRCLRLDRVAQRGSGAVRFQVPDIAGFEVRALERVGDDALLGDAVGHRQTTRRAVLVDRAPADDSPDPVTVANGVLEAFDGDDAAPLAAHIAVGGRVERLAPAVRREHVRVGERDHGCGREQHVRPARQREVAFSQAKCLARLMDGHQRRAACRVDRDRGALQAQAEADPTRRRGVGRPDGHVGLDLGIGQLVGRHAEVVVRGQADEHAGVGLGQFGRRDARMLDRTPRRFQQEPMLRIHQPDLACRHAEERCVESRHVVDETRAAGHHLAGRTGLGVEELVGVPAVLGHLRDRVAALGQHVPERFGVRCPGKTRRVADYGKSGRFDRMFNGSHGRWPPCIGVQIYTSAPPQKRQKINFDAHYMRAYPGVRASLSSHEPVRDGRGRDLSMLMPP